MDGVLVNPDISSLDFSSEITEKYKHNMYDAPGFFAKLEPMPSAIESYQYLCQKFDTYVLTAAPWNNPTAANDKINWVKRYLPKEAARRVIISHHKHLNSGDYLIDDSLRNGANKFTGKHIHFGSNDFPDWKSIIDYLDKELS